MQDAYDKSLEDNNELSDLEKLMKSKIESLEAQLSGQVELADYVPRKEYEEAKSELTQYQNVLMAAFGGPIGHNWPECEGKLPTPEQTKERREHRTSELLKWVSSLKGKAELAEAIQRIHNLGYKILDFEETHDGESYLEVSIADNGGFTKYNMTFLADTIKDVMLKTAKALEARIDEMEKRLLTFGYKSLVATEDDDTDGNRRLVYVVYLYDTDNASYSFAGIPAYKFQASNISLAMETALEAMITKNAAEGK